MNIDKIFGEIILFLMHNFKKKPTIREYSCSCGKKFKVYTNVYDNSDSGQGECECGECRVIIN